VEGRGERGREPEGEREVEGGKKELGGNGYEKVKRWEPVS